jgi:prepilin-type processing-associated H-X9-DG protein
LNGFDYTMGIYGSGVSDQQGDDPNAWGKTNSLAVTSPVKSLMCPSDSPTKTVNNYFGCQGPMWRGNYVANFSADGGLYEPGVPDLPWTSCHNVAANNPSVTSGRRGLLNWNTYRGIKDITDGTSNTAMLSEILQGPDGTYDIRGWWSNDWGGAFTAYLAPNSAVGDIIVGWAADYCVNSVRMPCNYTGQCWSDVKLGVRSNHTGGVNLALCDGSVRFLSQTINQTTWQAVCSIGGGEVIGSNF